MTESIEHSPSQSKDFTMYILWFVYACIIYSIIGFSWGAIMGGVPAFRHFVDYSPHGRLITLAHGHINLLGWDGDICCFILCSSHGCPSTDLQCALGEDPFLDA